MSTLTSCACPLRKRQISAAARPLAAMLVCAAAATRNDDGSCGSVAGQRDRVERGHVAAGRVSTDRSGCRGELAWREFQSCRHARAHRGHSRLFITRIKQDVDGRDKPGHDGFGGRTGVIASIEAIRRVARSKAPHAPLSCPAHAGIQYAAAFRSITNVSGMLDRPVKPDDDSRNCGAIDVRECGNAARHCRHALDLRGALRPRFCLTRSPFCKQRARGMPGAQCTRSLVCA